MGYGLGIEGENFTVSYLDEIIALLKEDLETIRTMKKTHNVNYVKRCYKKRLRKFKQERTIIK